MPFPAPDELIAAAEAELGRRLPEDHRARLRTHNGGDIEAISDDWQLFPVWDPTDRRTQRRSANHLLRENAALHAWPGLPPTFVAIAANGTGDLLGLLPGDDRVHWFDHDGQAVSPVEVNWRTPRDIARR
jgi:hypothetical protein